MITIYQTVNEKTGCALYADEYTFKGTFASIQEAIASIGRDFMRFCDIRTR